MQSHDHQQTDPVYKIVREDDWAAACRAGVYLGSADDKRDGFIHLSAAHQLSGTARKHFKDQRNLILVRFQASDLGTRLRWGTSRGGELFPHFYGSLPTVLAREQNALPLDADGIPVLPEVVVS